jgi:predicted ABC-type ATPase
MNWFKISLLLMPNLYILAGPNGAGKTTAAKTLLPEVFNTDIFINADNIAFELYPVNPESVAIKAGRIMLEKIQQTLSTGKTFAIETTLATKSHLNLVKRARLLGYETVLYFFYLPSAEMAKERVKLRVSEGGHNIPSDVIERRYSSGLVNFFEYSLAVNRWYMYENTQPALQPIARGEMPDTVIIYNFELWEKLKKK